MAPLISPVINIVMAAVLAASCTWKVQDFRYAAKERNRLVAEAQVIEANRVQTAAAAAGLEADKQEMEIRYETITKTVTKFIDRPVYTNICLDDEGIAAINGVVK